MSFMVYSHDLKIKDEFGGNWFLVKLHQTGTYFAKHI